MLSYTVNRLDDCWQTHILRCATCVSNRSKFITKYTTEHVQTDSGNKHVYSTARKLIDSPMNMTSEEQNTPNSSLISCLLIGSETHLIVNSHVTMLSTVVSNANVSVRLQLVLLPLVQSLPQHVTSASSQSVFKTHVVTQRHSPPPPLLLLLLLLLLPPLPLLHMIASTCSTSTHFMSSNSPSGGMKLMLCSVSNLLSFTH